MTKKKPKEILEAENSFQQVSIRELQRQLDLAKSDMNRIAIELKTERQQATQAYKDVNTLTLEVGQLRRENSALLIVLKILCSK